MEILKNFNDDTFELIADSQSYVLPEILGYGDGYGAIIKLSVFSNGSFQGDYQLEQNKDFYIKNEQLFLKPNEVLDRNNFSEGNYSLQFDFLKRYDQQDLYVAEVSPSRKEIRLRYQNVNDNELPKVNEDILTSFLNEEFTNLNPNNYKFNSFLELTQGLLIPINNYAFDTTTNGEDGKSVILKLNTAVPGNVVRLFNQPRNLYYFIGGNALQWITNGSGSLPLNSSATDIFIEDDNCLVDFNPSNSEFNTLQNQIGLKDVGVLTGDYKLNQPKDSRVQKQGTMEVPLLDDDIDKQAF